jgi:hypothetical protein
MLIVVGRRMRSDFPRKFIPIQSVTAEEMVKMVAAQVLLTYPRSLAVI